MKIKLYRGAHQIGGCVTGISTSQTRILIDMGSVLPDTAGNMPDDHLKIDEPYDAVVFTHNHVDHIGLMKFISPSVPLYIGEGAREIFRLAKEHKHSPLVSRILAMRAYRDRESFSVGDLTITPILTDHSAYDAYMLLIEGDGKKVLHTGDFRTHGVKGADVIPALENLRGKVDVMMIEGTNLSYENPITRPELELANAAQVLMDRFPYTFVLTSPSDIDRLAMFHLASESKTAFFCDAYQMKVLDAVRSGKLVSPLYNFERAQVYLEELEKSPSGFCMAVRLNKAFESIVGKYTEKEPEKCLFICSVSEGFLKKHRAAVDKITAGFRYVIKLHTSGHCSAEAIWQAVRAVQPQKVIPIHTEKPGQIRLGALQDRVLFLEDGETYDIL